METAELIEAAKLLAQLYFSLTAAANLSEQEKTDLLNSERERFKKNREQGLPLV